MALLPSGTALPPLPYLVAVLLALVAVVGLLHRRSPAITPQVVAAFAPWMVAGATGYALFQARVVPALVAPLFGSPTVYVTTFVLAGAVWALLAPRPAEGWSVETVPGGLALVGTGVAGLLLAYAATVALSRGTLTLAWPLFGLLASLLVAAGVWFGLRDRLSLRVAGAPGALAVFGHVLDGISTAVGLHLGFGEQTPLSALLIEFGHFAPLPEGWLFVLVKVGLAALVVNLLVPYVREKPGEGALALGAVAAVGLGPGAHNLVLFAIA
ncbi:DUF63 family protein [Natronomonas sp. EA1]|uniref:DUF63 family protein n=1 Tax=Natronomonas sp. EA1 TaxID=3421655 RepID=UPI003EB8E6EA